MAYMDKEIEGISFRLARRAFTDVVGVTRMDGAHYGEITGFVKALDTTTPAREWYARLTERAQQALNELAEQFHAAERRAEQQVVTGNGG